MRQREFIVGADRRRCWTCATALHRRCASQHRDDGVRGAHAHAAGAADDDRALPARRSSSSSSATRRGCRAAYASTNRNPLGACAITGTGFPIDRELHQRCCSASTARPATPTAASRPSTTCSRACRRRRCCSPASAASSRTCCCGARWSSAICGWPTASCSRAASCRRSATRWRSSTRARSAARRSARRRRSSLTVHNTPFGDIVDTEDDLQPLVASMFRDATRAVTLVARGDARRRVRRRAAGSARGRRWHDADRAGGSRWCASTDCRSDRRTRIAARLLEARREHPRRAAGRARCAGVARDVLGAPLDYTEEQLAEIMSPRHFVEVRRTPGGPAPDETGARARNRARCSRRATRSLAGTDRAPSRPQPRTLGEREARRCDRRPARTTCACLIVWVA